MTRHALPPSNTSQSGQPESGRRHASRPGLQGSAETYILIVDDDPDTREVLETLFIHAGYQVRGEGLVAEAIQAIREGLPSLVILDLLLPDGDGFELCHWIRSLPTYVPIIMLSGRGQMKDKVRGLEMGADDFVTKPFEPRELVARARATLRLAAQRGAVAGAQGCIRARHLHIWPAERRLLIDGADVDLTAREWALLELFLARPREVFGRETLLREIWGYDFLGDSRVVDVQIQRLRAKIERDPGNPTLIQTVRGLGYRFAPEDDSGLTR